MRIDIAAARYRGVDYPGIVQFAGPNWLVAGVVDGVGSWGAGMEAADWSRRHLAERGAAMLRPDAEEIVAGIQAVVGEIPAAFQEDECEFGCAFSIALVLVRGVTCHVIAAGAYGVEMIRGAASTSLFSPRRWVDEQVDKGVITQQQADAHPLHGVVVGPWLADGHHAAPLTYGPFGLDPGSSVLVAEMRLLDRRHLVKEGLGSLTAAAIQALMERPATPVVVIHA
jgi:hypothetical protein